jgi:hypothetical protein
MNAMKNSIIYCFNEELNTGSSVVQPLFRLSYSGSQIEIFRHMNILSTRLSFSQR